MKVSINTLYWDNTDQDVIQYHKKVMNHFDLDVKYYLTRIQHRNISVGSLWTKIRLDQTQAQH